nr:TRAP transporter small permease subunit [Marinicella sp. W31]MDC2875470.1 TRAP transporter small permease subunit [Marinicella sp. W31]
MSAAETLKPAGPKGPVWLQFIAAVSQRANMTAAYVAITIVVLMTGLILLEIGLRAFSLSTHVTDSWVAYAVAAVTFLSMPWVLEQGSMLRVSVVIARLPPAASKVAEFFGIVLSLAAVLFVLSYQWETVGKLIRRGTLSGDYIPVPLWIPALIFLIGLILLALQLLVMLLRLLVLSESSETSLSL